MALDLSYIIPIFCRRVFANHPDVMFKPGPFYMGDGWVGRLCNIACITWTLFVCVIFALPTNLPVTAENMNYAAVSVMAPPCYFWLTRLKYLGHHSWRNHPRLVRPTIASNSCLTLRLPPLSSIWYWTAARNHYVGPQSNLHDDSVIAIVHDADEKEKKSIA